LVNPGPLEGDIKHVGPRFWREGLGGRGVKRSTPGNGLANGVKNERFSKGANGSLKRKKYSKRNESRVTSQWKMNVAELIKEVGGGSPKRWHSSPQKGGKDAATGKVAASAPSRA